MFCAVAEWTINAYFEKILRKYQMQSSLQLIQQQEEENDRIGREAKKGFFGRRQMNE